MTLHLFLLMAHFVESGPFDHNDGADDSGIRQATSSNSVSVRGNERQDTDTDDLLRGPLLSLRTMMRSTAQERCGEVLRQGESAMRVGPSLALFSPSHDLSEPRTNVTNQSAWGETRLHHGRTLMGGHGGCVLSCSDCSCHTLITLPKSTKEHENHTKHGLQAFTWPEGSLGLLLVLIPPQST